MAKTMKPTVDHYIKYKNEVQYFASFKYLKKHYQNKRVLDLGCGTGGYLEYFGKGSVGIDASTYNLRRCKEKGLKAISHDLNKKLPLPSGSFDCVFCSHTLEHVDSPINLLREINRVLKKDGTIIIGLPTDYSVHSLLIDNFFKGHSGHLYSFSLDNLGQLFKKTGFSHQATYLDLNLVRRLKIEFVMDIMNWFPAKMFMWIAPAFWYAGEKTENCLVI